MDKDNFQTALERIEDTGKNYSAYLMLSDLDLVKVPESIGQLTQLQDLYLNNNELKELPESMEQLNHLRMLYLHHNQFKELPKSIAKLTHLHTLSLYNNQLKELPESVFQLTQLQKFYLFNNQLKKLPESIGQLIQLENLHLSFNQLKELPELIGKLTKLQEISLNNNQLKKLPESIGKLTRLRDLYLQDNQLKELPESIIKLKNLTTLRLEGNQQLGLPPELLGNIDEAGFVTNTAAPREILDFYFRVRENGRPLNEAKLILVGRGAVGKTSLVNQLIRETFNPRETKTEGIKIDRWEIKLKPDDEVRLNVWDFGGQEIMHATHQFFLTERSLYLLVLNGREGAEDVDAEYWLKLIDSFGGKSPVIVVLNKISEHPFDLNRRALLQKYPNIRDFVRTDCEKGTGIDELREIIKRETGRLDHLRVGFPSEWFAVKDKLATTKKNYLSFEQFRGICRRNKVGNKKLQETLAKYLNQLGIVLNYKDDARLRETHVLNPHWVTEGIYKILNSPLLEENKGEMRLDDISAILPEKDYPPFMCRFIFDLMKKFYLCFSFPDDECHYLIPELLGKDEPKETEEFNPANCLNFQYRYSILPEGILPRFIVRTNILSEDLPRWRSGVILEFEGCRALVKADVAEKRVSISISGKRGEDRRRLLAVIRSDFERIHNEIRNLEVKAMVPLPGHPDKAFPYKDLLVMEGKGTLEFPYVVDEEVINLNVKDLLNGVDLEKVNNPVRLFYSYSHKDEKLRNQMDTHLKILEHRRLILPWHDRQIEAGDDWKKQIDANLDSANVILLLISADFIASEYCYEKEMKRALERHKKGEAVVIPVILRKTNRKGAPFADLQALPANAKAVTSWNDRDAAWQNVSEGIEKVVEEMRIDDLPKPPRLSGT